MRNPLLNKIMCAGYILLFLAAPLAHAATTSAQPPALSAKNYSVLPMLSASNNPVSAPAMTTEPIASSDLSPELVTNQQQLNIITEQLSAISAALTEPTIQDGTLQLMQEQVESVLRHSQTIQRTAEKKASEINALITALGASPKATDPPEDPVTAAKRKDLTSTVAFYQGQAKQAYALISQALSLSNALAQKRLENKAKGLMQRSVPLYDPIIWRQGMTQGDTAMLQASSNTFKMFRKSIETLETPTIALIFTAFVVFISLLSFLFFWIISQHIGQRFITAKPSLVRKIITTLGILLSKAVIPLSAILLIVFSAKKYDIIYEGQWYLLTHFCLMLGGGWIAYLLVQAILAPRLPLWRILQIQDRSAQLLARQLYIFSFLALLNWFVSAISETIPIDFLIPCEFLLRTLACISGLILLKKHYWLNEIPPEQKQTPDTAATHSTPGTTRSAQRAFIHYLRIASVVVFLTNPLFMLLGYIVLANFLFISFIQTVAIVAILLGLHIVCYQILGKFIGIKTDKILDDALNLSERSRNILHYWVIVIIDLCFFIAGTIVILLTWGLDKQDLWRFIKPLLLGFNIGSYHFSLTAFFTAIAIFTGIFMATRLLQRFLSGRVFPYTNLDIGIQHAFHQGIGYIGLTIAVLVSIGVIGINLTSLALIAGALSVGIGFGLQNIVSNFIAGIIVLVERPIKIGDRIIVGQDEGTVRRISVRATELEASDGSSVLIPNSELISGRVRNWTFRNPLTKLDIAIGVAYGSNTRLVEKLLLQVASQHPAVTRDPRPIVTFFDFGASSLDFKLTVCVNDVNKRSSAGSDLRFEIERVFKENNIDIPFPQCDIRIVPPALIEEG
ncbi:MAG: mechanosensitive ion channel family protein [Legionellales bacterium]|nr:mechanosensitive ion channel family protein [Legionellales bacterium]